MFLLFDYRRSSKVKQNKTKKEKDKAAAGLPRDQLWFGL